MAVLATFCRITPLVSLALLGISSAGAAAFACVRYDADRDELVVTVDYRGTNPDHTFSLQWSECRKRPSAKEGYEIAAQMLDSQWDDRAEQPYRKTVRFDLSHLRCRPAEVTLRTAPGFHYTLIVPKATRS